MIACRGCCDHRGTGPLCHLNRHASHATSGTMNEKRLPTGKPCVLKKRLPSCQSNQGDSGCLYVPKGSWLGRHISLARDGVLRSRAIPPRFGERIDGFSYGHAGDAGPHFNDLARNIMTWYGMLTLDTSRCFPGFWPSRFLPHHTGRMDPNQDFSHSWLRLWCIFEHNLIRTRLPIQTDGFHLSHVSLFFLMLPEHSQADLSSRTSDHARFRVPFHVISNFEIVSHTSSFFLVL